MSRGIAAARLPTPDDELHHECRERLESFAFSHYCNGRNLDHIASLTKWEQGFVLAHVRQLDEFARDVSERRALATGQETLNR